MKYTYTIPIDNITNSPSTKMVLRSDGAYIPTDLGNSDYQAYLDRDNPMEHLTEIVPSGD